jgi:hypothetical protein
LIGSIAYDSYFLVADLNYIKNPFSMRQTHIFLLMFLLNTYATAQGTCTAQAAGGGLNIVCGTERYSDDGILLFAKVPVDAPIPLTNMVAKAGTQVSFNVYSKLYSKMAVDNAKKALADYQRTHKLRDGQMEMWEGQVKLSEWKAQYNGIYPYKITLATAARIFLWGIGNDVVVPAGSQITFAVYAVVGGFEPAIQIRATAIRVGTDGVIEGIGNVKKGQMLEMTMVPDATQVTLANSNASSWRPGTNAELFSDQK